MPYLSLQTNMEINPADQSSVAERLSKTAGELLGKPESYVMVALQPATTMLFGGDSAPAAYLQLKSLGLPESQTDEYSAALCGVIEELLGIPGNRVFIEFSGPARHMWGWNGGTF